MKKFLMLVLAVIMTAGVIEGKEPHSGYRGFIDWDITMGKAAWWSCADGEHKHEALLYSGLATSHGYQINRHTYVGAGFMLSFAVPSMMLPVFADFRYDKKFGKFTPYADCRLGYSICEGGGVYFSPTVGYRCNWGRKANFNIGVGLTLCGQEDDCAPGDKIVRKYYPRFSLRLGFDF